MSDEEPTFIRRSLLDFTVEEISNLIDQDYQPMVVQDGLEQQENIDLAETEQEF